MLNLNMFSATGELAVCSAVQHGAIKFSSLQQVKSVLGKSWRYFNFYHFSFFFSELTAAGERDGSVDCE